MSYFCLVFFTSDFPSRTCRKRCLDKILNAKPRVKVFKSSPNKGSKEACLLFKTNRPLVNISNELTDVSFFKVNIEEVEVDDIQQLDKHKIDVLPTFVLCKNGHAVETCKGKVLYLCSIVLLKSNMIGITAYFKHQKVRLLVSN